MATKRLKSNKKILNNLVLLKNFDEYKLKITVDDCVDANLYHISYMRDDVGVAYPLHLVIPEFYGHVEETNERNYLVITQIENNSDVLKDYKNVWDQILNKINKINNSAYVFNEDYRKFKLSSIKCSDCKDDFSEMSVDKLLKLSFVVVSCRLVIEKDNQLFLETYLEECFYEDSDTDSDNDDKEKGI